MNINPETASTLGDKLAGLTLTDEEGVLLTTLLAGDDDVSGFGQGREKSPNRSFEEIKVTYLPSVLGPLPGAWKVEIEGYVVTQDLQD